MSSLRLEDLVEGLRHVARHPLRSALTALTCAVAIAVTVNVISLNYGLDEDIRRDLSAMGRWTIDVGRSPVIRPDAARASFGEAELARVREAVAGLGALVVPLRSERGTAAGEAEVGRTVLASVTAEYPRTLGVRMAAGRWFGPDEGAADACVLDESAARALFPEALGLPRAPAVGAAAPGAAPSAPAAVPSAGPPPPYERVVGRRVRVAGAAGVREPRVVGVLADPLTYRALFESLDEGRSTRTLVSAILSFRNVYLPLDPAAGGDLTLVHVVLPDDARLEEARRRLEAFWPASSPEAVSEAMAPVTVFARRTWIDAFGGATQMGAALGNIVWILICLVACVMISTQNLMTVRERYDELAVRRCEGARRSHLVAQVTAEGVLTSLAGGLLGLPLGYAGAAVMRTIVDVPFRFDARYALPAVGVSVALGLLSSVLPARHVCGLDPAAVLSRRLS